MDRPDAALGDLLASPAFADARRAACEAADDAEQLRTLLRHVDTKRFGAGDLSAHPQRVEVDIACSIVTARAEDLESDPAGCLLDTLPVVESSRLQVVIAALEYFVLEDDVIPDSRPTGHVDDMTIVHWAVGMVQRVLPVDPSSNAGAAQS